jgi:hypothetical protein
VESGADAKPAITMKFADIPFVILSRRPASNFAANFARFCSTFHLATAIVNATIVCSSAIIDEFILPNREAMFSASKVKFCFQIDVKSGQGIRPSHSASADLFRRNVRPTATLYRIFTIFIFHYF